MDYSTPSFPIYHQLPELAQTHVRQVGDAIQPLVLCRSLLLLPSVFLRIRVFSNESALPIRWPKYWSFSLSISSSNEYSGLISFRTDWFNLLAIQGALKSLHQDHNSETSVHWSEVLLSKLGGSFASAICHPYGDPFVLLHFVIVKSLSCLTL